MTLPPIMQLRVQSDNQSQFSSCVPSTPTCPIYPQDPLVYGCIRSLALTTSDPKGPDQVPSVMQLWVCLIHVSPRPGDHGVSQSPLHGDSVPCGFCARPVGRPTLEPSSDGVRTSIGSFRTRLQETRLPHRTQTHPTLQSTDWDRC